MEKDSVIIIPIFLPSLERGEKKKKIGSSGGPAQLALGTDLLTVCTM